MRDRSAGEGFQLMEVPHSPRLTPGDRRISTPLGDAAIPRDDSRLKPARLGSLDARRLGALLILTLAGAIGVIYAGSLALDSAVRWLHQQSEYQVSFSDIALLPPPPPWFLGGSPRFLDRVRDNEKEAARIPLLDDARTGRVALAFSKFPWVRRVRRVSYSSKKIAVELEYYEPVAYLQINRVDQIVLDEAGHVLPIEDVDANRRPLIRIVANGISSETAPKPGLIWNSGNASLDHKILGAARLAAFLTTPERLAEGERSAALRIERIDLERPDGPKPTDHPDWLWITNRKNIYKGWGSPLGEETVGEMSPVAKWEYYRSLMAAPPAEPAKGR